MARRQQRRRPVSRGPQSNRREDEAAAQSLLDANARRLLASYAAPALPGLVEHLTEIRDEADRVCFDEPSPEALATFRRAARELAIAERALALAGPAVHG